MYAITPEESVLNDEKNCEILEFLEWVNLIVGDRDYQILYWSTVDGLSMRAIGKRLEISAPAVYTKLRRIHGKIQKYIDLSPIPAANIIGHLQSPQSIKEAGAPQSKGYPHEFLQNVSINGRWHTSARGRKRYIAKSICRIPEYFEQCFGDNNTMCVLECSKKCSIGGTK